MELRLPIPAVLAVAMLALAFSATARAADTRQTISLPVPMREHMLANMRDHLSALSEIQLALAAGRYEEAADIAEQRIGMSSLERHGAPRCIAPPAASRAPHRSLP